MKTMYLKSDVLECAKQHCKDRGIKTAEFARECGISESQMQYYFRGTRIPKNSHMEQICFALRIPFDLVEKDSERKTAAKKEKKPNESNGMYSKGNQILDDFMRVSEINNRTLANTMLVIVGWDSIVKRGLMDKSVIEFLEEVARS